MNRENSAFSIVCLVLAQLLIRAQIFVTPWTAAPFPVLHHLPEFAQTHVH